MSVLIEYVFHYEQLFNAASIYFSYFKRIKNTFEALIK